MNGFCCTLEVAARRGDACGMRLMASDVAETVPEVADAALSAPAVSPALPPAAPAPAAPAPARRLSGFGLGAAALTALALASAWPLSFTATSSLSLAVGIQPPAATVRGLAQVLGSREVARDALAKLAPADVARLAAGGPFAAQAEGDAASRLGQAARRVTQSLAITPMNGGREMEIAVSAPSARIAKSLADAYVGAALDLEALPRGQTGGEASPLPELGRGAAAAKPLLPDAPGPLPFTLLAAAAATWALGRRRHRQEPPRQGLLDRAELPRELDPLHQITWLDGHGAAGLAIEDAATQLLPHASASRPADGRGRLVVITSDGLPEAAGDCASALARRLAEEAGVVLVVLQRAASGAAAVLKDLGCELGDPGMRELLLGRARFGETLHRDPHSRAHVIPPGHLPPGWASATGHDPDSAAPLATVLDALRQTYDYVVVANPPLVPDDTSLAALDPLVVCVHGDTAPATAAVESFDALSAMRFRKIVLARLAAGGPAAEARTEMHEADMAAFMAAFLNETRPAPRARRKPAEDAGQQALRGAA